MCRNIRTLFNFDPPATDEEIHDAALQFVRKVSGSTRPSKRNEEAFERAVETSPEILECHLMAGGTDYLLRVVAVDAADFERIHRGMNKPAFAFDGRNILPHDRLRDLGIQVHAIGKPVLDSADRVDRGTRSESEPVTA